MKKRLLSLVISAAILFSAFAVFASASGSPAHEGYLWLTGTGFSDPGVAFKVPGSLVSDAPLTIRALVYFSEDCENDDGCVFLNCYSYAVEDSTSFDYLIAYNDYATDSTVEKGKWTEVVNTGFNPYAGTYGYYENTNTAPGMLTLGIGFYNATGTICVGYIILEQEGAEIWSIDFSEGFDVNDPVDCAKVIPGGLINMTDENRGVSWDCVNSPVIIEESSETSEEDDTLGILGDYNNDGTVNSNDAIYLLRHVLFPNEYPLESVYNDITGDCKVDSNDAIHLLRHVLFPNDFSILPFSEGLAYTVNDDGETCTITGPGTFNGNHLNVPLTINDYIVTDIQEEAFDDCSVYDSITIPVTVTYVGDNAFSNAPGLVCTVYTSSDAYYSYDAFDGVKGIHLIIPEGINSVWGGKDYPWGGSACYYNSFASSLIEVTLPKSLTTIATEAFSECRNLEKINIPENVTSIKEDAFYGCVSLKELEIPAKTNYIANSAFAFCGGLEQITVNSRNTVYFSKNNCLICKDDNTLMRSAGNSSIPSDGSVNNIGDYAFSGCATLTVANIPGCITGVGNYAFASCEALRYLTVSEGVESFGEYVFEYCNSLVDVVLPDSITTVGDGLFYCCESLHSVYMPKDLTSIGHDTFCNCTSLTILNVPETVTYIGRYAFYKCESLKSIGIPDSVTVIDQYAFSGCRSLGSITLPANLTAISNYCFKDCASLRSAKPPKGVTSIGAYAFQNCSKLETAILPESVTSIGACAYDNCTSLWLVSLPSGLEIITSAAFYGCRALTSINIPSGVTEIDYRAFYDCRALTDVNIPGTVKTIGGSAFEDCSSMTTVVLHEGTETIGSYAFAYCSSLTSINLPESLVTIGSDAFKETALDIETHENGLIYIGTQNNPYKFLCDVESTDQSTYSLNPATVHINGSAFRDCSSMISIVIPENVETIGNYAFQNCSGLTSVVLPEGVTDIGYSAFTGCSSLVSIRIPVSVTYIDGHVFDASAKDIYYSGTKAQWEAIEKDYSWNYYNWSDKCNLTVHCTDGNIIP